MARQTSVTLEDDAVNLGKAQSDYEDALDSWNLARRKLADAERDEAIARGIHDVAKESLHKAYRTVVRS